MTRSNIITAKIVPESQRMNVADKHSASAMRQTQYRYNHRSPFRFGMD